MYMTIQPDALELLGIAVAKGYVEPLKLTEEQEALINGDKEVVRNFKVTMNMRKYRLRNQLTQKELATKLGITRSHFTRIERRYIIVPVRLYPHIAKALGVTVEELLKEE